MHSIQEILDRYKNDFIVDVGYSDQTESLTFQKYLGWVDKNNHLPLTYLDGDRKLKRENLKNFWAPCESSLVFLFSYRDIQYHLKKIYSTNPQWNRLKIASYTLGFDGEDYHHYIARVLNQIGEELKAEYSNLEFKLAVDTLPILDRDLAQRAGLGWYGKNSMLINRHHGSFTIVASLLLNQKLPLSAKHMETDHCGQCTRCIDACPTQAIDPITRTIIAKNCISTYTIEQFKENSVPGEGISLASGYVFGCDICQDVCPWNLRLERYDQKNVKFNSLQEQIVSFFLLTDKIKLFGNLKSLSERGFRKKFKNTSFERSGKRGVLKNILFYLKELNILS
jgi:epoxyqueuosine reductase